MKIKTDFFIIIKSRKLSNNFDETFFFVDEKLSSSELLDDAATPPAPQFFDPGRPIPASARSTTPHHDNSNANKKSAAPSFSSEIF